MHQRKEPSLAFPQRTAQKQLEAAVKAKHPQPFFMRGPVVQQRARRMIAQLRAGGGQGALKLGKERAGFRGGQRFSGGA